MKQFSKYVGLHVHKATITVSVAEGSSREMRYQGEIPNTRGISSTRAQRQQPFNRQIFVAANNVAAVTTAAPREMARLACERVAILKCESPADLTCAGVAGLTCESVATCVRIRNIRHASGNWRLRG